MDGNSIVDYFVQIATIVYIAIISVNCIYGEDVIKNNKRVVLARDIQDASAKGESIDLNNVEVSGLLELKSCKSLSLQDCKIDSLVIKGKISDGVNIENCEFENGLEIGPGVIGRLEVTGSVSGDVNIKDCFFEDGANIANDIMKGTLKINRCEFKNTLCINNIEVSKGIIIGNDTKIHAGILIDELQSTQLTMSNINNIPKPNDQDDKVSNDSGNEIPHYQEVHLQKVELLSQLCFEDLNLPAIHIKDCTFESCKIKNNEVKRIGIDNMFINKTSYIDFNSIPKCGIKLINSNLGQHVRLNLPYKVRDESKIELSGTVANFDSLPSANDMLLMLQYGSHELHDRQTLAMLHRAYETSGAPYDAKIVRERMIKFDLDNCKGWEIIRFGLLYGLTNRRADVLIFGLWCTIGFFGFVLMTFAQIFSKKNKIILDYAGNSEFRAPDLKLLSKIKNLVIALINKNSAIASLLSKIKNSATASIIKNSTIASIEGMMPIQHIFGKHRCFGFSYIVYAFLKVSSWGVIMLYVRAFTM